VGEVDIVNVEAERATGGRFWHYPRRLQSLLIRGDRAPDVHVSLVTGGGQRPTPTVEEVRRPALEQSGECSAAVEVAGRSGAAPESAGTKRATPE
jgi:hypothetical protein